MSEDRDRSLERALDAVLGRRRGGERPEGDSMVLIRRETLADLQRDLEEILGRGAEGILVRMGYARGRDLAKALSDVAGGDPEGYAAGLRLFGKKTRQFRLEDWHMEGDALTLHLANSAIGRGYGTSDRPVCHYLRGMLLVLGEHLFRRTGLECRETRCVAMGASTCVFLLRPALVVGNAPAPAPTAGG